MNTIYKYPVAIGSFGLDLPKDAEVLTVQVQQGKPMMWVLQNTNKSIMTRSFTVCGTGHEVELLPPSYKYIGTFQLKDGYFVGHLFEEAI